MKLGRLFSRRGGIMNLLIKALMYHFLGGWAYLFGWTLQDVFIVPVIAGKLKALLKLPSVNLPVSGGAMV